MGQAFEVKLNLRLGHDPSGMQEMRVLNRIVRIVETRLRYEPDPRHAELLITALNLQAAKGVCTHGQKPALIEGPDGPDASDALK